MATNLYVNDYGHKVRQQTGFTATVAQSYATAAARGGGITWDGTVTISSSAAPNTSLKKMTGFNDTVGSSFASPDVTDDMYDLEWTSGNLYAGTGGTKVYKFSGFSSSISASYIAAGVGFVATRGMTFDFTNAYDSTAGTAKYWKRSGFTATITSSFAPTDTTNFGISWDGTNLLGIDPNSGKCRQYTGFSNTVLSSFTLAAPANQYVGISWQVLAAAAATVYNMNMGMAF